MQLCYRCWSSSSCQSRSGQQRREGAQLSISLEGLGKVSESQQLSPSVQASDSRRQACLFPACCRLPAAACLAGERCRQCGEAFGVTKGRREGAEHCCSGSQHAANSGVCRFEALVACWLWKGGGRFLPPHKSNSTECPRARSEFTENYVGRVEAVRSACFLGRYRRNPLHIRDWLSAIAFPGPAHVLQASLGAEQGYWAARRCSVSPPLRSPSPATNPSPPYP